MPRSPLKFLYPGWYAIVMGLAGLSLAWHRAVPLMGEPAAAVSAAVGGVAAAVFGLLAAATVARGWRHPDAWGEDRRHPVRHTFIAALPIAVLLLATVAVALVGPTFWAGALWWAGSLSQLFVTVWVLGRWWRGNQAGGLQWMSVTPALFIPIVGNLLAPLAGVPLGHTEWATAQCGIGLMFWPIVLVMILVRIATQGMFPDRLLPTIFIFIAPPAVAGLVALTLGASPLVAWMAWGMAVFGLLWVGTQTRRIVALPFSLPHWAMSFPLAALAALTLRLAALPAGAGSGAGAAAGAGTAAAGTAAAGAVQGAFAVLGLALLALASIVILALVVATLRGLRDGTLLAPEPVAAVHPVATGGGPA